MGLLRVRVRSMVAVLGMMRVVLVCAVGCSAVLGQR